MFILAQLCKSVDVFGVGAGATSTSSWHYWVGLRVALIEPTIVPKRA
jgi:hypothetical protein